MSTIDDAPENNATSPETADDFDDEPIIRRSTYTPPVAPATPVLPVVPQRRSLPDETLINVISAAGGAGGTLEMMAELESQLTLREEEAQEYKNWEKSMLAVGTEEAIDAVRQVRPQFEDVVPDAPALPIFIPRYPLDPSLTVPLDGVPFDGVPLDIDPANAVSADGTPADGTLADGTLADGTLAAGTPAVILSSGTVAGESSAAQFSPPEVQYATPPLVEPPVEAAIPGAVAAVTGSMAIVTQTPASGSVFDADVGGVPVGATTSIAVPLSASGDSYQYQPVNSAWKRDDDLDQEPQSLPAFEIERSGTDATPVDARSGHAVRMFWLWFGANASILSIGFGATIFALGISLRQSLVAIMVGVAVSCLPLGLATLAGKRSGQPTMIVSRAAFGIVGNFVPALLALTTRVFWGAVLLWLLATSVAFLLVGAQLGGPFGYDQLVIIGIAAGFLIAILIAFFGFTLLVRFQLVVSIVALLFIGVLIFLTWSQVDLAAALRAPDGNWTLAITGGVLVFSYLGLAWAQSGSDLARYQRIRSGNGRTMVWSVFGAALPAFALIAYGALLAASNSSLQTGLTDRPLAVLSSLLPAWLLIPLVAATALSLLSGIVISIYSSGFALQSVGIGLPRAGATIVSGLLVVALAWFLTTLDIDLAGIFRDGATTLAVPVAAWVGIFAADTMIRNRPYHEGSLLMLGGLYPSIHWVNVPMFFLITGAGFGLTTASVSFLSWQGYLFPYLGIPSDSVLASTDFGVFVALILGLATPIITGIPMIRRQESGQR